MSATAAVISIIVAGMFFWLATRIDPSLWGAEHRFNVEYKARRPTSDAEMIAQFYRDSPIDPSIPIRARRIFGVQLSYEAERLWPDDDFSFLFEELDAVELVAALEEAFGVTICEGDTVPFRPTIRDTADYIHGKLNGVGSNASFRGAKGDYNDLDSPRDS